MKRILLIILSSVIGVSALSAQNIPTYESHEVASSKKYQKGSIYQKDLLLYVDMLLSTHPYYADKAHADALLKRLNKMYKECADIDDAVEFQVYLAKIASALNDGHTSVPYWMTFKRLFPVRFIIDGDNPVVVDIAPEQQRELLGKQLKRVNGHEFCDILALARPIVSADNGVNFENNLKEYLMFSDFWALLGFSNEVLKLEFVDGSTADICSIGREELRIAMLQSDNVHHVTAQHNSLFDYTIFEKESICYMQFNQFADRITHANYQQLPRFDEFVRDMMTEIESKNIETLVVDLQYNGGGNSMLGTVLLSWLYPYDELRNMSAEVRISELLYASYPHYRDFTVGGKPLEMGKLYDLWGFDHSADYSADVAQQQDPSKHQINLDREQIFDGNVIFVEGKGSFSSALLLLTLVRDNNIGTIVGHKAGGRPSHYGDVLYCKLPNSGSLVTVSHKYFVRPNRELEHEEYLYPDHVIESKSGERDLIWEWIVENYAK